ncbi:MAG: hypothetical protein Q9188_001778 [Gyalolechia gomerana]
MPTFYARSINVRLSVAKLDKTITPAPLNTLCKESTLNADRATTQFEDDAKDGTLLETPLCSDKNKCSLEYLGERQDMPFLMVHAKPAYPFNQSTGTLSKAKRKPPPLRLPAVNGDNPDSPLTDFTSSPLTPVSGPDAIGSQDVHGLDKKQARSRPRRPSIRQLDGTGAAEKDLLPASVQQVEQKLAASPNVSSDSPTNPADKIRLAGTYSGGKDSLGKRPSTNQQPQAFCLRVLPTTKSFLCSCDPEAKWTYNDIKIDVYLNGDLCASSYISERTYQSKKYTQNTFSGARNGRLIEKPWVLVPPILGIPKDSANPIERNQIEEDTRRRWTAISDALNIAAESHGRDFRNELSVSGQYLQSLAAIPMPPTLPSILNTDHKRFSIIDVLVTSGKGNKDPVQGPYLMRPLLLKPHGYSVKQESSVAREQKSPEKQQPGARDSLSRPKKSFANEQIREQESLEKQQPVARDLSLRPKKSLADQQIALQPFSFLHIPRNSADDTKPSQDPSIYQAARKGILFQQSMPGSSNTSYTPDTEQSPISRPPTSAPKRLPRVRKAPQSSQRDQPHEPKSRAVSNPRKRTLTPLLVENEERKTPQDSITPTTSKNGPPKRRRIHYHDVIDTRQTQAEEMEDIANQAADKDAIFTTERRITRSKLANTSDDLEITEKSVAQEAVSKPYDSQSKLPNSRSEFALASLPKNKKHRDAPGIASPEPFASQTLPKSEPPAPSRRRRDGLSPPAPALRAESSSPEKPLMIRRNRSSTGAIQDALPSKISAGKDVTPGPATPKQCSSYTNKASRLVKPSSSKKKSSVNTSKPATWQTPPSSKESIVTYAEGGAERQIRAERGGWFREQEVLVGVRFVVG